MKKRKYPDLPERSHPDYNRLYREKNKERLTISGKEKYKKKREELLATNPNHFKEKYDPVASAEYREKNRKRFREHNWRRHGIKDFDHDQYLVELTNQDYKCKICHCRMEMPQVDHDHETGKYRGLLCKTCNFGLGVYEKNRESFEKYLMEHSMRNK